MKSALTFISPFNRLSRHALTAAIGAAMVVAAPTASAVVVDGYAVTVGPGGTPDPWEIINGGQLTITPGGAAYTVQAIDSSINFNGASLIQGPFTTDGALFLTRSTGTILNSNVEGETQLLDGSTATIDGGQFLQPGGSTTGSALYVQNSSAVITGAAITSVNGTGLSLNTLSSASATAASNVQVFDSTITAGWLGALIAGGGTLTLDNTVVTASVNATDTTPFNGNGAWLQNGALTVQNGSVITGATVGVRVLYSDLAGGSSVATTILTVDGAEVIGQSGAAIAAGGVSLPGSAVADIRLLNGSRLSGGNGNILEVSSGVTANLDVDASALTGNVVVGATESANLRFHGGASLSGALTNVTSMALEDTSQWNVTADSSVGTLDLGSGMLAFAAPSPGYKTVTVGGDLAVNGGTLMFNSVLAGDDAPSDKLVVGGSTSGSGNIVVNNIGGAGAQTVEGIQLISVAGASDAAFALSGRAVGGAYEYFLFKGGVSTPADGGWYLRSALPVTPDPCVVDPSLPQCTPVDPVDPVTPVDPVDPVTPVDPVNPIDPVIPVDPIPVLRPEPGAYLANQAAAVRMFQQRRHDRGEPAFDHDGAGAWARVSRDQLHTTIAGQVDARSQTNTLQIGSDVARWGQQGRGSVGIMLATGDADTQATSRITGYGTRGKVKGDAVGVYGSWVQNAEDSAGLYLDGWLRYGRYDSWVQGDALAREKYDATTRAASLEAGYAFALGNSERRAIYLQPQVQVSYTDYKGDTLQEVNGTIVEDDQAGGLETRVGVRLFGYDNAVGNRVQPFLAVNWLYNERGDSMRFDGQSLDAKLPTNRYEAQAGAQLRLGERWSAWGDLRVQRGDSGYKDAGAQLGVRRAW